MLKRILVLVACALLAGCTKNSVTQDFNQPVAQVYAALLGLDAQGGGSTSRYQLGATHVLVEGVPNQQVTWRMMSGDDELYRLVAELTDGGGVLTEVTLKLDRSHAPDASGNPALVSEINRLDKGRRLSIMAEKIAARLENRSFEEARVDARLKDFALDSKTEQVVMVSKIPSMTASALGQYAQMQKQTAAIEAAEAKRRAEAPPPAPGAAAGGGYSYAGSQPMSAAEEAAERQRNR